MPNLPAYKKAVIALIITNVIWGAASPIFKWSLKNIPPFSLAFLRFYYGSLILMIVIIIRQQLSLEKDSLKNQIRRIVKYDFKNLILLSLCGITFNITFFFLGLNISSAIDAPVIASAGPVFTFILAIIFLKEKFRPKKFLGMMISLIGVIFIIIQPILEKNSNASILGNLFFVLATLGAVGQSIFGKKIYANHNFILVTFISFIIGTITFIPFAIYEYLNSPDWLISLNNQGILGIIFGALFSSVIAYTFLGYGLSKIPASEVAIFTYIDPVIAVLIAIPLLGERISLPYLAGSLLVISGIYIAENRLPYQAIVKKLKTDLNSVNRNGLEVI